MLTGLDPLELGRLRVSVGYGTHRKGRPLSPVEVAELIQLARLNGNTLTDCAKEIRIDESGLGRFLRLLELPDDLRHLVDWGGGGEVLGFSTAIELVRIANTVDMYRVKDRILETGLTSKETRQVVQLLERSERDVDDILHEVIGMRPVVERRFVFIGSVISETTSEKLTKKTQRERNDLLERAMARVGILSASGRLGSNRFTLVGGESFDSSLTKIGREKVEDLLCSEIAEELGLAAADR